MHEHVLDPVPVMDLDLDLVLDPVSPAMAAGMDHDMANLVLVQQMYDMDDEMAGEDGGTLHVLHAVQAPHVDHHDLGVHVRVRAHGLHSHDFHSHEQG